MVISAAEFGQRSPWPKTTETPPVRVPGERLDFLSGLEAAFSGTLIKLVTPNVSARVNYTQKGFC